MFESKEELLMAIQRCLPYADQIQKLDFSTSSNSISFVWRCEHFKIDLSGQVGVIDDGCIVYSSICIIFRELLRREWLK